MKQKTATKKRTPFTQQKDSFCITNVPLLECKRGTFDFSSVIFGLFSHYFSAFQPLFIGFSGSSDVWSDTILSISTNCRRLWRPRHSLSKQAVHIINNKNTQTNCTGYGGDAIASYCLLCQLTCKTELTILSLHIPDEPLFSCCLPAFQPQILYQVSDEILALAFEHIDYRNLNHCVASRLLAH